MFRILQNATLDFAEFCSVLQHITALCCNVAVCSTSMRCNYINPKERECASSPADLHKKKTLPTSDHGSSATVTALLHK